jgi:hypothetical protein
VTLSTEAILCSASGIGLTTATPVQRAICRALDGVPLGATWEREDVRAAFGGVLPSGRPEETLLLCGTRTGKSLTAAAKAIQVSQTVRLAGLVAGEIPRIPIVSTSRDNARVIYQIVRDAVRGSSVLRGLLVSEPIDSEWCVTLRHPSGVPIEIKVVAGSRAGASLVARWMPAVIFDEAARMIGSDDGVVNLDDARKSVLSRVPDGGIVLYVTSPWAPMGPVYDMHSQHRGQRGRFLVVQTPGRAMNPGYWTPEREAQLAAQDPTAYRTDCLGEFAAQEATAFRSDLLSAATQRLPEIEPFDPTQGYAAWMDPATRNNAWTLVVCSYSAARGYSVALARQWQGTATEPLSTRAVMRDVAASLAEYHLGWVGTDQYMGDALVDVGAEEGLSVVVEPETAATRYQRIHAIATQLAAGRLSLPPTTSDSGRLVFRDLVSVKRRLTQGGVTYVLPLSTGGRHCDYVPSLAGALDASRTARVIRSGNARASDDGSRERREQAGRSSTLSRHEQIAARHGIQ